MKENYDFADLCQIISELRGEDGCPWDKAQTYKSLQKYLIEESYEYIDATNEGDRNKMCDELGDVLLQVMLNSKIADEENAFNIDSVIDNISKKMIKRHPHIFDLEMDKSINGILDRWEEIKKEEKGDEYSLKSVGKHLPMVARAAIIVEKSKKMHKNEIIFLKNIDKLGKMLDNIRNSDFDNTIAKTALPQMMMLLIELFVEANVNLETSLYSEIEKYIDKFQ
jgi:tetrapyrrole methylase family protein/MazG family protein